MKNERGAITIHVAIAMTALLAFAGVVVDFGVWHVARGQAQNAADAGALAGALSLLEDPGNTDQAIAAAKAIAGVNEVWGERTQPWDVVIPTGTVTGKPGLECPAPLGWERECIRVEVLRGQPDSDNGTHQNTIPTFMVRILGPTLHEQGTRAMAIAQISAANTVQCMKPWAILDKWTDSTSASWSQSDRFNPGVDTYAPLGFKVTENAAPGAGPYAPVVLRDGIALRVDFDGIMADDVRGCRADLPPVGLYDDRADTDQYACASPGDLPNPELGCLRVNPVGITAAGVADLIALDPLAEMAPTSTKITGGCMATEGGCANPTHANVSPRLVPVAVINTDRYVSSCGAGDCVAQVVNIVGFFVEGTCDSVWPSPATRPAYCGTPGEASNAVVGRLTTYPGYNKESSTRGVAVQDTFLRYARLIR